MSATQTSFSTSLLQPQGIPTSQSHNIKRMAQQQNPAAIQLQFGSKASKDEQPILELTQDRLNELIDERTASNALRTGVYTIGTYAALGYAGDQFQKREVTHHNEDHKHDEKAQETESHSTPIENEHALHGEINVPNLIKLMPTEAALDCIQVIAALLVGQAIARGKKFFKKRAD